MSLQMITSFMQPNGSVPKSALTVLNKANDDVEIVTSSEDKTLQSSLEGIGRLMTLHERIAREGMSREAVTELQAIAPSAVPGGYGLEAFTLIPSNVMMKEGLESIATTALNGLMKLIRFLLDKLKAGFNFLIDSYQALTGIAPSAYKLAKQEVYREEMVKRWKAVMQSDLDEDILTALKEGAVDEDATRCILDGYFNDADSICNNLAAFESVISDLQRGLEDLLLENTNNNRRYNELMDRVSKARETDSVDYNAAARVITSMLNPASLDRISKTMDVLAKKTVESKLYKPDDKTGKSILDRLNSDKFRDVLSGLQEACTVSKPIRLGMRDGLVAAQEQRLGWIVDNLRNFRCVNFKNARDLKQQVDNMRLEEKFMSTGAFNESELSMVITKYMELQNDIKSITDVVRKITGQYAETVFKLTAFRNNITQVAIVRMVATSPESKLADLTDQAATSIKQAVKEYITRVTGNK